MKLSRFVIHSFVVFSIKALKVLVTLYGSKRNRIQYLFQLVSLGFKSQQWNDWLAWGWMLEQHTWCYYNANPNLVMKMSETYTGYKSIRSTKELRDQDNLLGNGLLEQTWNANGQEIRITDCWYATAAVTLERGCFRKWMGQILTHRSLLRNNLVD